MREPGEDAEAAQAQAQIDRLMAHVEEQLNRDMYAVPPGWVAVPRLTRWQRFRRDVRARYWSSRQRLARAIYPYSGDDE